MSNAYAQFLERYGTIVAAIAWSKSQTEPGVVTISIHQGNPRLGFRPRSQCSPQTQALVDRCDFETNAVVHFPDGMCCNFTPPMPPAQCYELANVNRSQFTVLTTPNFRW